ncbi:MAG TPA: hypothetical protein VHH88_01750, partial [Verrucomicrobiae bacterium]|nr:hypothetical protein [Verrucomicrobiae bacterium]
ASVQPADAGAYQVIVTNVGGSVTSSIATLTVVSHPALASPERAPNGNFTFVLNGDAGQNYSIETSTNLVDWIQIGLASNIPVPFTFTVTNSPAEPFRAYRARWLP